MVAPEQYSVILQTRFASGKDLPDIAKAHTMDDAALMAHCRQHLPVFMLPRVLQWVDKPLPRSPNGKLDRQRWMQDHG